MGHYYPVCLIFKRSLELAIKRIFPFDSGAFVNDFYASYLHRKMKLGDFWLEPDIATPSRIVEMFFGSVPAYLRGKPAHEPRLDPADFEALSYLAIVTAQEGNSVDSRGSGVEVQCEASLDLASSVEAVVLPGRFADGATGARLKSLGIHSIPYRTYERTRPSEYTTTIHDLCLRYYVENRLLKEDEL